MKLTPQVLLSSAGTFSFLAYLAPKTEKTKRVDCSDFCSKEGAGDLSQYKSFAIEN